MSNVNEDPMAWGLKVVATISQPNLSWEFDEYTVWVDGEGKHYYAHSSGCSCPTPYEEYETLDSLSRMNAGFFDEIKAWYTGNVGDRLSFVETVSTSLLDNKLTPEEVAAHQVRKAQEEFRTKVRLGVIECRKQLSKVVPAIGEYGYYDSTTKLVDVVSDLQETKTSEILVLGVYLTRIAEDTLKADAAADE